MATKKMAATKTTSPATEAKPKTLKPHEIALSTVTQNAVGIYSWSKFAGESDLGELVKDLHTKVDEIKGGDLGSVEAMLYGQAKVLETMFTSLARRAANNDGLKQFQCNLTLALKAQSQCRATLEALAEIKNPRTMAFVKQTNMTTGPQQVINGGQMPFSESYEQARTGAGDFENEPNKLLESEHGERMDTRATPATGRSHTTVAAMG